MAAAWAEVGSAAVVDTAAVGTAAVVVAATVVVVAGMTAVPLVVTTVEGGAPLAGMTAVLGPATAEARPVVTGVGRLEPPGVIAEAVPAATSAGRHTLLVQAPLVTTRAAVTPADPRLID